MSKKGGSGFNFSGFSFKSSSDRSRAGAAIPPPAASVGLSKHGYSTMSAITNTALSASWSVPKKRTRTEEE